MVRNRRNKFKPIMTQWIWMVIDGVKHNTTNRRTYDSQYSSNYHRNFLFILENLTLKLDNFIKDGVTENLVVMKRSKLWNRRKLPEINRRKTSLCRNYWIFNVHYGYIMDTLNVLKVDQLSTMNNRAMVFEIIMVFFW